MGNRSSSKQLQAPTYANPHLAKIHTLTPKTILYEDEKGEMVTIQRLNDKDEEEDATTAGSTTMIWKTDTDALRYFLYAHRKFLITNKFTTERFSTRFGQDEWAPFFQCEVPRCLFPIIYRNQLLEINTQKSEPTLKIKLQKEDKTAADQAHTIIRQFVADVWQFTQDHLLVDAEAVEIVTNNEQGEWETVNDSPPRPLDTICLPKGQKEAILKDLKDFQGNMKRLQSLGLPSKRGYLLCGVPGTGKTSLILALAAHFKFDIGLLSLAQKGLNDATLAKLMKDFPSKTVLVIEDIDRMAINSVQDGKESDKAAAAVSLSCLLSVLDGALSNSRGQLVFFTTNNPKSIDPVLLRPGRVDFKMEMGYAVPEQVADLARVFWPDSPEVAIKMASLLPSAPHTLTTAAISSAFIRMMHVLPSEILELQEMAW